MRTLYPRKIRQSLLFFDKQKRIVEQYKTHGRSATPEESAIIVNLERMLRQEEILKTFNCLRVSMENTTQYLRIPALGP